MVFLKVQRSSLSYLFIPDIYVCIYCIFSFLQVSEPSGARFAPEKTALMVGCRGFVSLQVSVSTFEVEVSGMAWHGRCFVGGGGSVVFGWLVVVVMLLPFGGGSGGGWLFLVG